LLATDERELRVIFRGSINAERLPEAIVMALAHVGEGAHLDIAGYETGGSRGYVTHLMTLAESLGVADRIRVLGTVPDEKLAAICERCDVGLALMPVESLDENMRHMTGASNKVFEYLTHGVTPLVSDLPDWRATFVDPGYALACDPRHPESIARVLTWVSRHRADSRAMAASGWERLRTDWNYETQFAPVLRAMWAGHDRGSPILITTPDAHVEAPCAS
jgi:glycosyltransferase involved in cell wall biosynthesis